MSATAAKKVTKARASLVMSNPFFGTLALRMKTEASDKTKTAVCDGTTIRYNPKYIDSLSAQQCQGLMAALVMHPAFLHHTRRGTRDKKKWNEACDHAIHTIIKNANLELPKGKFADPKYNGMSAEHIYSLLPVPPPNGGKGKGKGSGSGDGDGDEDENGSGGNDDSGDGEVDDSPNSTGGGGSQSQQNHEEAEWKIAVAQAVHVAKQSGKLPGDLERMMQELMEPVLPWRDILRRFMTEKCNDDFSWMRGNRRFLAQGLYLPSRRSEDAMDTMVVAIDTSGSIGEKELTEFGSEIADIHKEVRPKRLVVIYCDAQVNHVDTFGPDDELQFKLHGGGGTDFRPPFAYLNKEQIVPKCFAYLTDGYGPFPEVEPAFPTIWCINNHDVTPPHGEHVILDI